ncbi:S24 family peptidase [Sphingomonas sp. LY54]|uniref:S24 family peptidase n=1 Tax=Sphingomonas sp. LY54 TaxID=3095343 RepID=UPI002D780A4B|nr:S24 family peptidase [Sphingomonas sp. LY54]WRP29611.1 S24 family peptidase [Sphingomonas sp. LY54]
MDARAELERLIRERGEDYASLSRLIGRNAAYVQQFIKRGTPRTLAEEDRRILARYFGVPEERLGGQPASADAAGHVIVPHLELGASAGPGALPGDERAKSHFAFDSQWLKRLGAGDVRGLSIIGVEGDSMVPTLADGDEIMVDRSDVAGRLRDGIYVLRIEDALMVKRLSVNPVARTASISSDNSAYPSWPDCPLDEIDVVGRVVWAGRRIA